MQGYDPLKPSFKGPGFYHLELTPSLELHTHDEATVKDVLKHIAYPDGGKLNLHVYNLPYNQKEFYNGMANEQNHYDKNGSVIPSRKVLGCVLFGRCTSIPTVMTEFVVPHEIGHAYQYRYLPSMSKDDKNWQKYIALHGLHKPRATDRHHESNAEIFANTFRILFSPYQHDFWPHKAKHPLRVRGLKEYLSKVLRTTN